MKTKITSYFQCQGCAKHMQEAKSLCKKCKDGTKEYNKQMKVYREVIAGK